ncbi:MAG: GNAT family N-acetyltransferase [Acidimicrobiia bacterium]|nr:GNAT family N-acetyltransferase [Acidimicrobiia bacterium]
MSYAVVIGTAILRGVVDLRPARDDDSEVVAAIYIDSWNQGFGHLLGIRQHSAERIDRWSADLASPATEWTVAEVEGRVVGFIGIGPSRDPVDPALGELDTIAVDPSRWRQGVGRALTVRGLDQLSAKWNQAILWTPANHPRGHRFYEAMGWRQLERTRYSGTEVAFGRRLQRTVRWRHDQRNQYHSADGSAWS